MMLFQRDPILLVHDALKFVDEVGSTSGMVVTAIAFPVLQQLGFLECLNFIIFAVATAAFSRKHWRNIKTCGKRPPESNLHAYQLQISPNFGSGWGHPHGRNRFVNSEPDTRLNNSDSVGIAVCLLVTAYWFPVYFPHVWTRHSSLLPLHQTASPDFQYRDVHGYRSSARMAAELQSPEALSRIHEIQGGYRVVSPRLQETGEAQDLGDPEGYLVNIQDIEVSRMRSSPSWLVGSSSIHSSDIDLDNDLDVDLDEGTEAAIIALERVLNALHARRARASASDNVSNYRLQASQIVVGQAQSEPSTDQIRSRSSNSCGFASLEVCPSSSTIAEPPESWQH